MKGEIGPISNSSSQSLGFSTVYRATVEPQTGATCVQQSRNTKLYTAGAGNSFKLHNQHVSIVFCHCHLRKRFHQGQSLTVSSHFLNISFFCRHYFVMFGSFCEVQPQPEQNILIKHNLDFIFFKKNCFLLFLDVIRYA